MAGHAVTRASDELVLRWLSLRTDAQLDCNVIGERFGVSQERVRVATNRVRDADLDESGEDYEAVKAQYWPHVARAKKRGDGPRRGRVSR
ncbi:hypothetical protein [Halodurantibacterium flavum]|uniref:RNA polymerase sigma-70 region 4 domain-containing protein n=1 Tax=Halodurantibacterium flavum TaxID=1382802 RepID=A0ABW4S9M9_9RHOB